MRTPLGRAKPAALVCRGSRSLLSDVLSGSFSADVRCKDGTPHYNSVSDGSGGQSRGGSCYNPRPPPSWSPAVVAVSSINMPPEIDALTSSTLRHLRERWWNDSFTSFLEESLRPRPGKRILHVGCGDGTGEVSLSRLRLAQIQLFGVDLLVQRLRQAREATRGANARASYAQSDACRLPFRAGVFDSSYCVAVTPRVIGCSLFTTFTVNSPSAS